MTVADKEDTDYPPDVEAGRDIPPWMANLTRAWLERFGLATLQVNIKVMDVIDGDEDVGGHAFNNHNYLFARITLTRDAKDDPEHNRYVIHEVSHLAQGEMLFFVEHILIPSLPKGQRKRMRDQWEHVMEQYNTLLTRLLYRLALPTDYAERIEPLAQMTKPLDEYTLAEAADLVILWCEAAMPQLIRDRPEFEALQMRVKELKEEGPDDAGADPGGVSGEGGTDAPEGTTGASDGGHDRRHPV